MRQPTTRLVILLVTLTCLSLDRSLCDETTLIWSAEQVCVISDERIRESSGLALSQRQTDAVWIHNDSGDVARLFLVGFDGSTRGVFHLKDVPRPVDWEDMCGFTVGGESWLIIGDVGDNSTSRHIFTPDKGRERACRLLFIREPEWKDQDEQDSVPVHATIVYEYDDGPHNCESVAVDTERGEILLVTKSKSVPLDCGMYVIPLTLEAGTHTVTARRIGSLNIRNATAMDLSPDHHHLVIISQDGATLVDRTTDEGWGEAIQRSLPSFELPKRKGGETVCFGRHPVELFLNSEHVGQPLWRVQIPANLVAP